jgi:hypothetical protein
MKASVKQTQQAAASGTKEAVGGLKSPRPCKRDRLRGNIYAFAGGGSPFESRAFPGSVGAPDGSVFRWTA